MLSFALVDELTVVLTGRRVAIYSLVEQIKEISDILLLFALGYRNPFCPSRWVNLSPFMFIFMLFDERIFCLHILFVI